jgi:SAM-dependent methyltransferase
MATKRKNRKVDSKETGLVIGLYFFKFWLKSEYLHYGYFTPELEADVTNLKQAQINYEDFLISHIPEGTKTVLDVGCGSGKMAQALVGKGYDVECVSPARMLTEYANNLLKGKVPIHTKRFEDMEPTKKYDLIIFSESFQYIPMHSSIQNCKQMLNRGGHIMVSDFFKTDAPGKSPLGGGHKFSVWQEIMEEYKLVPLVEKDITDHTAPTMDIVNTFSLDLLHPTWRHVMMLLEDKYPRITKFIKWKYRKKIEKLENKHFKGERNAENFKKYKKYIFYVFKVE